MRAWQKLSLLSWSSVPTGGLRLFITSLLALNLSPLPSKTTTMVVVLSAQKPAAMFVNFIWLKEKISSLSNARKPSTSKTA